MGDDPNQSVRPVSGSRLGQEREHDLVSGGAVPMDETEAADRLLTDGADKKLRRQNKAPIGDSAELIACPAVRAST